MTYPTKHRIFAVLAALVILFTALLNASPVSAQGIGTAEYTVQSGDTLKKIADRWGLTIEKIMAVNKNIKDPNILFTGQVIILPVGRSEGILPIKEQRIFYWQREREGKPVDESERLYLVKSGDSVIRIAKAYGITEEKLLSVNPQIDDGKTIFRGELIHIPYGLAEMVPPFYKTPKDTSSK